MDLAGDSDDYDVFKSVFIFGINISFFSTCLLFFTSFPHLSCYLFLRLPRANTDEQNNNIITFAEMVQAHQNPNYNSSKNGNFTILRVLYLGGGDQQGILREFLVALGREGGRPLYKETYIYLFSGKCLILKRKERFI